jgi:anti-sigma factor RsiW
MHSSPNSHDACPLDIDEIAEAYVMGRLSPADALQFANHCLTCHQCAAAEEEADSFVRAVKAAGEQFRAESRVKARKAWAARVNHPSHPIPRGAFSAQMRFYVTGYEPPRG